MSSEGRATPRSSELSEHMLIILISLAWLAVVVLSVAACRMAASADRAPAPATCETPRSIRNRLMPPSIRDGLLVFDEGAAVALDAAPQPPVGRAGHRRLSSPARRPNTHGRHVAAGPTR
jgi:hypothetical protein